MKPYSEIICNFKIHLIQILFLFIVIFASSCVKSSQVNRTEAFSIKPDLDSVSVSENNDDSLDIIRKMNSGKKYTENIFLGFKLGMTNSEYLAHCRTLINKGVFDNKLAFKKYIFYFKNESVVTEIELDYITPKFYKDRLYELVLTFNNNYCFEKLENLYIEKYGKDHNDHWIYGNLDIHIFLEYNQRYKTSNYNTRLYYASSYHGTNAPLTNQDAFTYISYTDTDTYRKKIEEEQKLENEKRIEEQNKQIQKEQERIEKSSKQKSEI